MNSHNSLSDVLDFPHVSRPGILFKAFNDRPVQIGQFLIFVGSGLFKKMHKQGQDIFGPLPNWRNSNRHNIEAIEKIFPKRSLIDHPCQIAICCRNESHASIGEVQDVLRKQDMAITAIPEVENAVGILGRVESPLDPAPISMIETVINLKSEYIENAQGTQLRFKYNSRNKKFMRDAQGELIPDRHGKPFRQWRDHIKKPQDIWDEIVKKAQILGTTSAPKLQPIAARIVMLQSGMRAPMGIKVRGPNLETIEKFGLQLERCLKEVPTTMLVFSGIVVAASGGFILIWLYGQDWFLNFSFFGTNFRDLMQVHKINLSVAVWVGFLALFGIASDDAVVICTYLEQRFSGQKPKSIGEIRRMTIEAATRRVRPAMMTSATTILALLPVLTSTGRGADVMVPMAIPSFGGMMFELMTIFQAPILYCMMKEWTLKKAGKTRVAANAEGLKMESEKSRIS